MKKDILATFHRGNVHNSSMNRALPCCTLLCRVPGRSGVGGIQLVTSGQESFQAAESVSDTLCRCIWGWLCVLHTEQMSDGSQRDFSCFTKCSVAFINLGKDVEREANLIKEKKVFR